MFFHCEKVHNRLTSICEKFIDAKCSHSNVWFIFIRPKSIRGSVSVTEERPNNFVEGHGLVYDNPSQAWRSSHEARGSPRHFLNSRFEQKMDSANFG